MTGANPTILPYRCSPGELVRWVEARARGRTPAQMRGAAHSPKALEGASQTAALLGFADGAELSARGRELALAEEGRRGAILREAILGLPAYRSLLAAIAARGRARVEASWIEAWWATHGFGSSASNRREGTAVLGRLAERAALGRYVPGRRGHPTRIEWDLEAIGAPIDTPADPPDPGDAVSGVAGAAPPGDATPVPDEPAVREPAGPEGDARAEVNRVVVALESGRTARLELPARLSRGEKRRLLELVELLVTDD